jgi:hypothetical protein
MDGSGLEYGSVAGFCEHGNECSCFIKTVEFLVYLRNR